MSSSQRSCLLLGSFLLKEILSNLVMLMIQHPRQKHMIVVAEVDKSIAREGYAPDSGPEALATQSIML